MLNREPARWEQAHSAAANGPRVLIANAYGTDPNVPNVDAMLAVALTFRGASVHLLRCDQALPACCVSQIDSVPVERFVEHGPSRELCQRCVPTVSGIFQGLGLPVHLYSELITDEELQESAELSSKLPINELVRYRDGHIEVGEHALAGALRFYACGDLQNEPLGSSVLRRYFNAALRTVFALRRLLSTHCFTSTSALHGIYIPEGIIGEVAREQNVRVVNWTFSYRNKTFIFSHGDTYHHTLMSEPSSAWENLKWTQRLDAEILDYLNSRRYGSRDWIRFNEHPQENGAAIASEIEADLTKPWICLLTNVVWDAQLSFPNNAFANMLDWLTQTIRYFEARRDLQLVIRVHPGELLGHTRARQTVTEEIKRVFPTLPGNISVIPPESTISTYALTEMCDCVIIYATKTGVEVASMGVPVIVAGEAWIRNKGLTLDASTPEEYFDLLDRLPLKQRLEEQVIERAKKYAYHFFFRRMIPLPFRKPGPSNLIEPDVSTFDDLLPGRNLGLDVICDGILTGSDFIYPAERAPIFVETEVSIGQEPPGRSRLRIAEQLGRLGEIERMRVCLLEAIKEAPSLTGELWSRAVIARNISRIALASDKPFQTLRALWTEIKTISSKNEPRTRFKMRRLLAQTLVEVAIASWETGAYRRASWAVLHAMSRDPGQLLQASVLKRFARVLAGRTPKSLPVS